MDGKNKHRGGLLEIIAESLLSHFLIEERLEILRKIYPKALVVEAVLATQGTECAEVEIVRH